MAILEQQQRRRLSRRHTLLDENSSSLGKEPYNCLSALTALMVPFSWGEDSQNVSAFRWSDKLLRRTLLDPATGKKIHLWEINQSLPLETAELSVHFRQIVGWNESVRKFMQEQMIKNERQRRENMLSGLPSFGTGLDEILRTPADAAEQTHSTSEAAGQ